TVPERVSQQIRDDSVERVRVDERREVRGGVDDDSVLCERVEPVVDVDRLRRKTERVGLETREVEQVLDQVVQTLRLLRERAAKLGALLRRDLVLALVERAHDAVDRRRRRPQLV